MQCLELTAEISSCKTEAGFFSVLRAIFHSAVPQNKRLKKYCKDSSCNFFCHTNVYSPHGFIPFPFKHQLLMNNVQVECVSYM